MQESYQKNVRTSSHKRVSLYSHQPTQEPPTPLPITPFKALLPDPSMATQAFPCHPLHSPPPRPSMATQAFPCHPLHSPLPGMCTATKTLPLSPPSPSVVPAPGTTSADERA